MKLILTIESLLTAALKSLQAEGAIWAFGDIPRNRIQVARIRARDKRKGDFASNLALLLAAQASTLPARKIAERLVAAVPLQACQSCSSIEKIEVADPGFIHFFIKTQAWSRIVLQILTEREAFGRIAAPRASADRNEDQVCESQVYESQSAHARICIILRQLEEQGLGCDEKIGLLHLSLLESTEELALLGLLHRYPEAIDDSNASGSHPLVCYLQALAKALQAYCNVIQLLSEDLMQRQARLCLLLAVRQVLHNGLQVLGFSSPESL